MEYLSHHNFSSTMETYNFQLSCHRVSIAGTLIQLASSINFISPSKFLSLIMVYKALQNLLCYLSPPPITTTPSSFRPYLLYSPPCSLHSCLNELTLLCSWILQYATTFGPTALTVPRPETLTLLEILRTKNLLPKIKIPY